MAVAFDAGSESHTGVTGSISEASFSWSHDPVGTPRGLVVFVVNLVTNTDKVTSVTYDGTNLSEIPGATAQDAATELGHTQAWFLGSSVPTTDPATVQVTRTNDTDELWAVCISVTAAADTEVYLPGIVVEGGNRTVVEVNVTDGSSGVDSLRVCGAFYGGAGVPPAGANTTIVHDFDTGNQTASVARETNVGQGSRPVGWSAASDDWAAVYFAVREIVPGKAAPPGLTDHYRRSTIIRL